MATGEVLIPWTRCPSQTVAAQTFAAQGLTQSMISKLMRGVAVSAQQSGFQARRCRDDRGSDEAGAGSGGARGDDGTRPNRDGGAVDRPPPSDGSAEGGGGSPSSSAEEGAEEEALEARPGLPPIKATCGRAGEVVEHNGAEVHNETEIVATARPRE